MVHNKFNLQLSKQLRIKNITIKELLTDLDIPQEELDNWNNGFFPDEKTLLKLANYFQVSPNKFI